MAFARGDLGACTFVEKRSRTLGRFPGEFYSSRVGGTKRARTRRRDARGGSLDVEQKEEEEPQHRRKELHRSAFTFVARSLIDDGNATEQHRPGMRTTRRFVKRRSYFSFEGIALSLSLGVAISSP